MEYALVGLYEILVNFISCLMTLEISPSVGSIGGVLLAVFLLKGVFAAFGWTKNLVSKENLKGVNKNE